MQNGGPHEYTGGDQQGGQHGGASRGGGSRKVGGAKPAHQATGGPTRTQPYYPIVNTSLYPLSRKSLVRFDPTSAIRISSRIHASIVTLPHMNHPIFNAQRFVGYCLGLLALRIQAIVEGRKDLAYSVQRSVASSLGPIPAVYSTFLAGFGDFVMPHNQVRYELDVSQDMVSEIILNAVSVTNFGFQNNLWLVEGNVDTAIARSYLVLARTLFDYRGTGRVALATPVQRGAFLFTLRLPINPSDQEMTAVVQYLDGIFSNPPNEAQLHGHLQGGLGAGNANVALILGMMVPHLIKYHSSSFFGANVHVQLPVHMLDCDVGFMAFLPQIKTRIRCNESLPTSLEGSRSQLISVSHENGRYSCQSPVDCPQSYLGMSVACLYLKGRPIGIPNFESIPEIGDSETVLNKWILSSLLQC